MNLQERTKSFSAPPGACSELADFHLPFIRRSEHVHVHFHEASADFNRLLLRFRRHHDVTTDYLLDSMNGPSMTETAPATTRALLDCGNRDRDIQQFSGTFQLVLSFPSSTANSGLPSVPASY